MTYFDFNDAEQQQSFDLIPKGTPARVRMSIKPGGFDDPSQGWTGGWATQSFDSGAIYLSCEAVVMEGPFARRKVWWNIGLHSAKGPTWGNMGRTFVRAALNSARNIHPGDNSPYPDKPRWQHRSGQGRCPVGSVHPDVAADHPAGGHPEGGHPAGGH